MPGFKGYIHDVGGPTANFTTPQCKKSVKEGPCRGKSCMFPKPCESLRTSHKEYLEILRTLRGIPGIKKVFIRSGLRYDYILADPDGAEFLDELCRWHVSGQLKIAPEHSDQGVLSHMRKAPVESAEKFIEAYKRVNERLGKKQFLVPYFMSSHPGCGLKESLDLALFIKQAGLRPEQAQEFTPTPGTIASCMYHTGADPLTGESVYVAKGDDEKRMQRALLQYWMPENRVLVEKALRRLNRLDLIGGSKRCLIV
jgi:uncharacterized radical SAM protein YgiQ